MSSFCLARACMHWGGRRGFLHTDRAGILLYNERTTERFPFKPYGRCIQTLSTLIFFSSIAHVQCCVLMFLFICVKVGPRCCSQASGPRCTTMTRMSPQGLLHYYLKSLLSLDFISGYPECVCFQRLSHKIDS